MFINCEEGERCVIVEHAFVAVPLLLSLLLTCYVVLYLTRIDKRNSFYFRGQLCMQIRIYWGNVKHVDGVGAC